MGKIGRDPKGLVHKVQPQGRCAYLVNTRNDCEINVVERGSRVAVEHSDVRGKRGAGVGCGLGSERTTESKLCKQMKLYLTDMVTYATKTMANQNQIPRF